MSTLRTCCFLLLLLMLPSTSLAREGLSQIRSWLCYYESAFPPGNLKPYDLYVFQPSSHPALAPITAAQGKSVGYISFGEINQNEAFFSQFSAQKLLIEENTSWPGAFRIDLRAPQWHTFLLRELIPKILAQGFDGIFIDTIDTAQYLEQEKGMQGSIASAIQLIQEIRKAFPTILIILNNGLFLAQEVGETIDALVVEDVFTTYDFQKKRYLLASPQWTQERVEKLLPFQTRFHKPILSLDYVKASDKKRIKLIAEKARQLGFVPYLAEVNLNTIFFQPHP